MRTAKITAATKAPEGGRIETANGQPSGVFVDAATDLIAAVVPRPLARDRDRAFLLAQARLLEQGITTIADIERKSVVSGKSVSVRLDLGGRRIIKKNKV